MIYFIQAEDAIKIGFTEAGVVKRLRSLQQASPVTLKVVGVMDGGRSHESALHALFEHYRLRGEWFAFAPDIAQYVDANCSSPITLPRKTKMSPAAFKSARKTLGLSVSECAQLCNVDARTIRRWETGAGHGDGRDPHPSACRLMEVQLDLRSDKARV